MWQTQREVFVFRAVCICQYYTSWSNGPGGAFWLVLLNMWWINIACSPDFWETPSAFSFPHSVTNDATHTLAHPVTPWNYLSKHFLSVNKDTHIFSPSSFTRWLIVSEWLPWCSRGDRESNLGKERAKKRKKERTQFFFQPNVMCLMILYNYFIIALLHFYFISLCVL